MKIKYNARNVGAAALGCAMIAGTVCAGEETVSPSIASLTNMQEAAIPSTDTDWAFSFSAGWSSKYVTEGLDCLPGSGSEHFLEESYVQRLVCRRRFRQLR